LTAEAPCGPNLEYDPAFRELEQSVIGKPEVQYGSTITPAVPPEWKLVKKQAIELLQRTRDLRAVMPLARALLALHGLPGFADGAALAERLIDARWESVHPLLDADDNNDPTERINALSALTDSATLLRELKEATFIQLPGLGPLSLRVLDLISCDAPAPPGQSVPNMASIEAALMDVSSEALASARGAASGAYDSIANLEVTLVRHVGSSQALNRDPLTRQLRRIRDLLNNSGAAAQAAAPAAQETEQGSTQDAPLASHAQAAISGEINSRADVIRMLDKILAYYARSEPSSPVPMLLERAKRLAPMSFLEVMEDLAPDGMSQVRTIRGPLPEDQEQ
jgi:type VI secretion system protein ImpA